MHALIDVMIDFWLKKPLNFQMKRETTFSMKEVKVLEFAMMNKTVQFLQDVNNFF